MVKRLLSTLLVPLGWTIFMEVMFFLPAYDLPSPEKFEIPHFDKLVHVVFFTLFVWLWSYYFYCKKKSTQRLKTLFFIIYLVAAANGILVEYIQLYFAEGRSFDPADMVADLLGASVTYGICNLKLLKINS